MDRSQLGQHSIERNEFFSNNVRNAPYENFENKRSTILGLENAGLAETAQEHDKRQFVAYGTAHERSI